MMEITKVTLGIRIADKISEITSDLNNKMRELGTKQVKIRLKQSGDTELTGKDDLNLQGYYFSFQFSTTYRIQGYIFFWDLEHINFI